MIIYSEVKRNGEKAVIVCFSIHLEGLWKATKLSTKEASTTVDTQASYLPNTSQVH